MSTPLHVLLIEDSNDDAILIARELRRGGYAPLLERVDTLEAMSAALADQVWDVVIADYSLPRFSGLAALELLRARGLDLPFILVSGTIGEDIAVAAMKAGAHDYLMKDNLVRLVPAVERELQEAQVRRARRQADVEILRLQHLLQNMADSMPSALITVDTDGQVLTWNPVAEKMTGRTADQVRGQSLWQACPELVHYDDLFEQVLRERRVIHRHRERLAFGAGTVYLDVSVFPLEANNLEGVVLRIDDVTQRVQLEEMMIQSAKLASVGGLAAGVAHEINNPLTAMMQSAQMLQLTFDCQNSRTREHLQACGVNPEGLERYLRERNLMEYLDGIRASGGRAAKIVSDLLSFSRKTSSDAASHDLNALVQQTLELAAVDYDMKKAYDFRDIKTVLELDPDLPSVFCDGQQIQQVILNLVRNAAQAMAAEVKRGEEKIQSRLTLRTSRREGRVRLEVEDNGPGIPEAARARLFEPFFTTKAVGEGTGLGLWLSWSIVVERHRGRMWVEPATGGGSCFVVELPTKARR